jgi:hypothetical protein
MYDIQISGTLHLDGDFTDDSGETVRIVGEYEQSTIPGQTVLFRVGGSGPEQIELWNPTRSKTAAAAALRSGRCHFIGKE